jgi:CHAT domain/Ternary complex associated domain 7
MRCAPAIVIRASSSVRQGIRQLEHAAAHAEVVLVREHDGEVLYYVFSAAGLRTRLSGAQPDTDVASAIHLGEDQPAPAGQLDLAAPVGSVALEGRQVIGIIVDGGGEGGGYPAPYPGSVGGTERERRPRGYPPPPARRGITVRGRGFGLDGPDELVRQGPQELTRGGVTVREVGPTLPPDMFDESGDAGAATPAPPPGLFRAYPDVVAPSQVGAGQSFTLSVGFSLEPSPSMVVQGPPIIVRAGQQAEFVIQVTGFGFTFPHGIQKTLVVDRKNPQRGRVEFTVTADPATVAAPRFLEVSYEFEGVVVGRTWAQVQVVPGAAETATPALVGGGGVISPIAGGEGPHLTVDIFSREGDPELQWLFHCRYPEIVRPGAVTTTLNDDSAQSFAVQLMRQIPSLQSGFLTETMQGVGEIVADAVAPEFWPILEETWKRARADGQEPQLQITTNEPWIPWELAWIDKDRLDEPDTLLPDSHGGALGQRWLVGRWTPLTRRLVTGDVPASPPASTVDATEMAVIIGNYQGAQGIAELPNAVAEGNEIATDYGALALQVSHTDVKALMSGQLQRHGKTFAPTVIHFAGHGHTDVANPQFTGLVLTGGYRLDPLVIRGFRLVEQQRPFVFLNACEAGVGGETLTKLGGLVGAFLAEKARGFVAPLWKVDDVEASLIALEFYRRTFEDGQTVGEAMREIRRRYTPDSTSATALAYVFYGNPALRLQRGSA